jgi:hypothetical protein
VPIAVTDDVLGLALAARIADFTSLSAVCICWIWGPNCDRAAVWNSVRLAWMLSIAVCTPVRPLLTLSDPSAPTDAFSLLAAAQYAGVPLLAPPPPPPPAPGLVGAVVAPGVGVGVGVGVEVPFEQPAMSAPTRASAATIARPEVVPVTARAGLARAMVRAGSAPLIGYSYRRSGVRWRRLAKRPVPVSDAQ